MSARQVTTEVKRRTAIILAELRNRHRSLGGLIKANFRCLGFGLEFDKNPMSFRTVDTDVHCRMSSLQRRNKVGFDNCAVEVCTTKKSIPAMGSDLECPVANPQYGCVESSSAKIVDE